MIIVFLDSSTTSGNSQQGLAALLVFLCSTGLHFMFQPYDDIELNYLEGLGLVVSMLTLYLGLWTFSITNNAASILVSVLIYIINGIWLLCVSIVIFSSFGSKVKRFLKCLFIRNEADRDNMNGNGNVYEVNPPPPPSSSSSSYVIEMSSMSPSPLTIQNTSQGRGKGKAGKNAKTTMMINPLENIAYYK